MSVTENPPTPTVPGSQRELAPPSPGGNTVDLTDHRGRMNWLGLIKQYAPQEEPFTADGIIQILEQHGINVENRARVEQCLWAQTAPSRKQATDFTRAGKGLYSYKPGSARRKRASKARSAASEAMKEKDVPQPRAGAVRQKTPAAPDLASVGTDHSGRPLLMNSKNELFVAVPFSEA